MQLLFKEDMAPEEPLKTLSSDYLSLLTEGQAFSDVTFLVEGRRVHAHSCILAARSSFFRTLLCNGDGMDESQGSNRIIPVGVVGYDVFLSLLRFLYSGQLLLPASQHIAKRKCHERACWQASYPSSVELELALDTLHAARFFGVEQLSALIQKQLASLVEKASAEDVMRILMAAKKQELQQLWLTCSELVARSGLTEAIEKQRVPLELVREIEEMRTQRPSSNGRECKSVEEQRVRKMQQALDSLDVELVRLMVMDEGLNLDKANALHYAVGNCSREVVKALLEMGVVDVNYLSIEGKAALHIASEMVRPEMIAVLLDHHASPQVRTCDGASSLEIVQALAMAQHQASAREAEMVEHCNKLQLCLELLQSAVIVATKEEPCRGVMAEVCDDDAVNTGTEQNDVLGFNLGPDSYGIFHPESVKSSAIANGSRLDGMLLPRLPGNALPTSIDF